MGDHRDCLTETSWRLGVEFTPIWVTEITQDNHMKGACMQCTMNRTKITIICRTCRSCMGVHPDILYPLASWIGYPITWRAAQSSWQNGTAVASLLPPLALLLSTHVIIPLLNGITQSPSPTHLLLLVPWSEDALRAMRTDRRVDVEVHRITTTIDGV
jgi:hypothetical protein